MRVTVVGKRIARFVFTLFLVTFLTTCLLSLVPGDTATAIAGPGASQDVIDALNEKYGFNDSVFERYVDWVSGAVQGDFGTSYTSGAPVTDLLKQRIPVTLQLAIGATVLSLIFATVLAMMSARRSGSLFDRTVSGLTYAQISLPSFVIAVLLVYIFGVKFEIFPVIGYTPLSEDVSENFMSMVLPVVSIALIEMVILQRVLRADLVDTLKEDYIMLARAKGLPVRTIMWKHAFKPASFSLLTLTAISAARLLGGTVIVESIFQLPGVGTLLLNGVMTKDLVLVQGLVSLIAIVFLVVNLLVDLAYGLLDPRLRTQAA